MRAHLVLSVTAASVLLSAMQPALGQTETSPFVYESGREFFTSADLDGDTRADAVIVDKETGKFRLGYQLTNGVLAWVDCRISGNRGIAGVSVGRLLTNTHDALVFTSPDDNQISIVDASNPTAPSAPRVLAFTAGLGPNTIVAVDVGGEGNTPLADLYVSSMYNSPDANLAALLRNDGAEFPKITEAPLTGTATHGNRIAFKAGQPGLVCLVVKEDADATLRAVSAATGKAVEAAIATKLPAESEYAVGNFRGSASPDFLTYKPGDKTLSLRSVEEAGDQFKFAEAKSFELSDPIRRVITLNGKRLFVIFGEGEKAGVFLFDGSKAPTLIQTVVSTNELLTCAMDLVGGLVTFSHPAAGKFSTRYLSFKSSDSGYAFTAFGGLPSLADNDNITIPEIHRRIVNNLKVKSESEMKPYTNTIPGTQAEYVMVPIPAGEFVMGTPESESGRKPDEGPQHKVKISPFWMGQCEVTWNEYELFMYPDEEKRTRETMASDRSGDKLADAVTHPSRPYVEMSFGMGKDNFPAISMTQHGANKYCQWLSAKTGEFYRLPTEAEWEYACRAGTKTAYFFGDDAAQLPQYAWFEQNSDFKYQKVRKKKPNPWGLYDIYGNVVEWVLDQYDENYYKQFAASAPVVDPWNKASKPYPHSVRGGSWDDEPSMCRSGARRGSERAWKMQDPQLPKSVWYHSDAQWVGFRVVRPLKVPSAEELQKYWTSGVEKD